MLRVLAVDDSPTQLESLRLILEGEGFDVTTAQDAEAGLDAIGRSRFDLIISDIVMPGKSGYDLCREVKDHPEWSRAPVILLTSLGDPMDIIRGLEAGADNFITKPYEPAYLIERVSRFLETRDLRVDGKFKLGIEIFFLGKKFVVSSDKEQILDLLISTFEDIVRTNKRLQEAQAELSAAKQKIEEYARALEGQVELSEQKYQRLMAQANDAMVILDEKGRFVDTNRRAEELFGYPQIELIGRDPSDFAADNCRSGGAALEQVLRDGHLESTGVVTHSGGTKVDVEYSASMAQVGDELLIMVILRDVTERKRAEASRALLAAIVESSDDAIIGTTPEGLIVSWNRGAELIYGYSAEEVVGKALSVVVPEDRKEEFGMLLERLKDGETTVHLKTRGQRKDRRLIDVSFTVSPIKTATGEITGASVMARDITTEKVLEEQTRLSSLGRVAATIAHEMNNVLMGIQPFTELLQRKWGHEPEIESITGRITNSLGRGKRITEEILRFTKPTQPNFKPLDLVEWARTQEPEYREAVGPEIDFRVSIHKGSLMVAADQYQIQQVITNLILNARDATPAGGRIEFRVCNGAAAGFPALGGPKGEHFGGIVVADTGSGMTPAVAEQIFEPLFTTKHRGTGLGLAVAHQIVTSHGGIITLETAPERGTRFLVALPLSEA